METQFTTPLVQVEWLNHNLDHKDIIILDATLPKVVAGENKVILSTDQIPGARLFDIKNTFSKTDAPFPNTMINQTSFSEKAQELGINNDSLIIVYDDHGIYSSARVWWMFKSMGHRQIAVLDGGLKAWKKAGYNLEAKAINKFEKGDFSGQYQTEFFKDSEDVLGLIGNESSHIVDARAAERFQGAVEEPRKGLRAGHIPSSVNLPYNKLLKDDKLKTKEELKSIMNENLSREKDIIFSCGSGITACVLALGAEIAGFQNLSIYDGSWTEWGSLDDLPIATGKV